MSASRPQSGSSASARVRKTPSPTRPSSSSASSSRSMPPSRSRLSPPTLHPRRAAPCPARKLWPSVRACATRLSWARTSWQNTWTWVVTPSSLSLLKPRLTLLDLSHAGVAQVGLPRSTGQGLSLSCSAAAARVRPLLSRAHSCPHSSLQSVVVCSQFRAVHQCLTEPVREYRVRLRGSARRPWHAPQLVRFLPAQPGTECHPASCPAMIGWSSEPDVLRDFGRLEQ